ncbi:hypothetical protein BRCH_01954c [Candidatus Burkholderia brachyanthoides]|nr:hypothetical protein BRCH_01954c [Candidatus Burkholderia brachyanthoides]
MYRCWHTTPLAALLLWGAVVSGATAQGKSRDLFSIDWREGIDARLELQRASPEAIRIVGLDRPDMRIAIEFTIERSTNYRGVANSTPRAEVSFNRFLHFAPGREYVIRWQTLIPEDYHFDTRQPELIAQIHQGPAAGYPPFALFIAGNGQYEVHNRTNERRDAVTRLFGTPLDDCGHVVDWLLRYVPDDTGRQALTELSKDGRVVFQLTGKANAYRNDDGAYLKLGLYKAAWQHAPSDVDRRSLYYGRVSVQEK